MGISNNLHKIIYKAGSWIKDKVQLFWVKSSRYFYNSCHLQTTCTVPENVHGFYHRDALPQITESENRMYLFSLRKRVHPNLVLETCTSNHGKAECQEKVYLFLVIIKKMSVFLQQLSHTGNSIKHLQEITSFEPHNIIIIPISLL